MVFRSKKILLETLKAFMLVGILLSGCGKESMDTTTVKSEHFGLPTNENGALTVAELAICDSLMRLMCSDNTNLESRCTIVDDAEKLIQECGPMVNGRMIVCAVESNILVNPITRVKGDGGLAWSRNLSRFIENAHFAAAVMERVAKDYPTFDDLLFDMRVRNRLLAETSGPFTSNDGRGPFVEIPITVWERNSFYGEGSDMRRYLQKVDEAERKRVGDWYKENTGWEFVDTKGL